MFLLSAVMELSNCIGRPTAGLVTTIGEFESRWSWRELLRFSKDGDTFGAAGMTLAAPAFVVAFNSEDFPRPFSACGPGVLGVLPQAGQ